MADTYFITLLPELWKKILVGIGENQIMGIGLLYALIWLVHEVMNYIQDLIFFPIINEMIRNLQLKVVTHMHLISYPESKALESVKILSAIKRISLATRYFLRINFLLLLPCILKISTMGFIISNNTNYGLFFVLGIILLFITIIYTVMHYGTARKEAWKITDEVGNSIAHSLLQPQVARYHFQYESERLQSVLDKEKKAWYIANSRLNYLHIALGILMGCVVLGPLLLAIRDFRAHKITQGDLIVLQTQLFLIVAPLRNLITEIRQLVESTTDMSVINHILCYKKKEESTLGLKMSSDTVVDIHNLCFSYTKKRKLFAQAQAKIRVGQKILLQGESGIGKTTLLDFIAGVLKSPQKVHMNTQLRFFYIPQNAILLNTSLEMNLTFGAYNLTQEEIVSVLNDCDLLKIVESLPEGLQTQVGDLGTRLSGGERQRVLIARALLQKPDFLIMDETLDGIDHLCRKKLYEKLWRLIPTIIWTSHDKEAQKCATERWEIVEGSVEILDDSAKK